MHEIITIQIGKQANYACTHFWNTQESYFTYSSQDESPVNHDIHFRPGIGGDGSDTFTPRTLIYDFKQSYGALRKYNELYSAEENVEESDDVWSANSRVPQRERPIQPSTYQQHLNEGTEPPALRAQDVRFWSDYNRVFYHPNSIVQLYETSLSPERKAFESWQDGEELFGALDQESDVLDEQLRPLAEECDQMQGLQILSSVDDGWGGFACNYVERLSDEFGKSPLWTWAFNASEATSGVKRDVKASNQARSVVELASQTSIYIPISFFPTQMASYVSLDRNSHWSVSALQETAFESMLLPTRLKPFPRHNTTNLGELLLAMNLEGDQKVGELQLNVAGMNETNGYHDIAGNDTNHGGITAPPQSTGCDFFPLAKSSGTVARQPHCFSEVATSRSTYVDGLSDHLNDDRKLLRFHTDLAFPLADSFPKIFPNKPSGQKSLSLKASILKSSRIADWCKTLESSVRRRITVDEREHVLDGLKQTSDGYVAGWGDQGSEEGAWDD